MSNQTYGLTRASFRASVVLLLLLAWTEFSCDTGSPAFGAEATTIVMVRHAEKSSDGEDPSLSTEGSLRAQELLFMLQNLPLDGVYATPYKRTRETAEAVAVDKHLEVLTYDPSDQEAFLKTLLARHPGGAVLVVGHSNTIPQLANLLTNSQDYSSFGTYDSVLIGHGSILGQGTVTPLQYRTHQPEQL